MRTNKWLILGLVVSVGINLAMIGFFAGRVSHPAHPRNLDPTTGFMRVLASLPDARRRELRPLARERMREVVPSLRQMRSSQRQLSALILAEPFDAAALAAALAEFRRHLGTSQVASHEAFVTLVGELSPTERRVLVETMQRPRRHPRGRGNGPGPGANDKMLGPPTMDPHGVDNRSAYPVRRRLPGSLPSAHRNFRF